jgi:hypothetical protein
VKFARSAYAKRKEYRGALFNHAVPQITNFRVFDKQAAKRPDDIANSFTYAVLRCLGDGRTGRWDRLKRVA